MSQETMEDLEQQLEQHEQRLADAKRIAAGESGVYASNAMVKAIVIDLRLLERERDDLTADVRVRDGLIAALEDDKRELRDENLRMAKALELAHAVNTGLNQRLASAQHEVEELTRDAADVLDKSTALFNRLTASRLGLIYPARPYSVQQHEPAVRAGVAS